MKSRDSIFYHIDSSDKKSSLSISGPVNNRKTHLTIESASGVSDYLIDDAEQLRDLGNLLIARASIINERPSTSPLYTPTGLGLSVLINGDLQRTLYSETTHELSGDILDFSYNKLISLVPEYSSNDCTFILFTNYDGSISREQIRLIIKTIVLWQRRFIASGAYADCRKMSLSDIANILGTDESIISRATQSVRILTKKRIFTLNNNTVNLETPSLFDSGTQKIDNTLCSRLEVIDTIQRKIAGEDSIHPYTDDELAEYLGKQGYVIERRTVAKYRKDFLHLPNSNQRRQIS